jgi:hypothetical protein
MQIRRRTHRLVPAAVLGGLVASVACGVIANGGGGSTQPVAQTCPSSITEDIFPSGCIPSVKPPPGAVDLRGPGELPTLYGIPCKGNNSGTCIGLSQLPTAMAPRPGVIIRTSP